MTTFQDQFIRTWRYNRWAYQHIFNSMARLSDEAYFQERPLFWGSLHGLLAHCLAAELIWISRLDGENPDRLMTGQDYESLSEIVAQWDPIYERWLQFISNTEDKALFETIDYRSTSGSPRKNKRVDIIQHVFNHGTEHRSQMTPVLFNLNHPTPPLDFIYFAIEEDQ